MIFRLVCLAVIAAIIVRTNSSPVSISESEYNRLNEEDYDYIRMSSKSEDVSRYDGELNIAGTIQKTISDSFRQIRRNTLRLIDSSSKALETGVRISQNNLLNTIGPMKNALKANMHAAQKLGELAINTVARVPAFGIRIMQNFSKDSRKPEKNNEYS